MICSCGHEFKPSADTFYAPQLFPDLSTGASWLYLILHTCPTCGSKRSLVMFCAVPEDEEELFAEESEAPGLESAA